VRDGDQALAFIYLIGCLILVGTAFAVRRVPIGQGLKMALAWILIFAAAFFAFALRNDFRALGNRLLAEVQGGETQQTQGGTLRIRRADDGHFWVDAAVNGQSAHFLVDSGATMTTLTRDTARRAGIEPEGSFGVMVDTANGPAIEDRATARTLTLGPISRSDFAVDIASANNQLNVIGMNFLSSLHGWGVEGDTLVLRP
jgi:aspartyl protease family protein